MITTADHAPHGFFGWMKAIDDRILAITQNFGYHTASTPSWTTEIMRDFSAIGGTAFLTMLTTLVVIYLLTLKHKQAAFRILVTVISGTVLSNIAKAAFDRPRPEVLNGESFVVTASFPSGHSLISMVVFLTLGLFIAARDSNKITKRFVLSCAVLLPLLVGISRVYLGVHWPTDVFAGWFMGAFWALFMWRAGEHICKPRSDALKTL